MVWIQLTRTNVVFSRIVLVSRFCAEIQLSGKIPENIAKLLFYPKTHGARRRDREGPRGANTMAWHGPGQAAPRPGVAASLSSSHPPFAYILPLHRKHVGVRHFSRKSYVALPPLQTLDRGPETPFWHSAETGNWRISSPSSSPTLLHQPSMLPPSMCE